MAGGNDGSPAKIMGVNDSGSQKPHLGHRHLDSINEKLGDNISPLSSRQEPTSARPLLGKQNDEDDLE